VGAGPLYRGRVAVTLRPMGVDEFARWLPKVRDFYAQDMVTNGGASEDEAQRKAIADTEQLFPGDQPCADQFVFVIEADGEQVGELWMAERRAASGAASGSMTSMSRRDIAAVGTERKRCSSRRRRGAVVASTASG
jgi:hypothetical protein